MLEAHRTVERYRTLMPEDTRGRRARVGRGAAVAAVALGLIATTSCTSQPEAVEVTDPAKLMQSVQVGLSPSAAVRTVKDTVIKVGPDGSSSTASTDYDTSEVAGDLPVRVSLRYHAGDRSGSDLDDLAGYSGPLQVDLTLENLTVRPQAVKYDVDGTSRAENALVGAPMTIAASTSLPGVQPDDVTPGSSDGTTGTNGVLSATADGTTQVQWATVLAPPRSGASTTLRLQADVKDLAVPSFDVAVQPGLTSDLSGDGVISDAFASGDDSQRQLQERTIALVSDVNTVLTRAGSTITDVRENLEASAETLGVKTAGELRDNSKALAATMKSLKGELGSLREDLDSATEASGSQTVSQLEQTVSAVDSMLGDTSATAGGAAVKGQGCSAQVAKPGKSATVYSSLLTMSSQLDAYATVNADCRDTVASALRQTMGPAEPTAEQCDEQYSMTCTLYGSAAAVTVSLVKLVDRGDQLVSQLQPEVVAAAITAHDDAEEQLGAAQKGVDTLLDPDSSDDEYQEAYVALFGEGRDSKTKGALEKAQGALEEAVTTTRSSVNATQEDLESLRKELGELHDTANTARGDASEARDDSGKLQEQTDDIAERICTMAGHGVFDQLQADQLAEEVNGERCPDADEESDAPAEEEDAAENEDPVDGSADDETPADAGSLKGKAQLQDAAFAKQEEAWDAVLTATDHGHPENAVGLVGSITTQLEDSGKDLDALDAAIDDALGDRGSVADAAHGLDDAAKGQAKDTTEQLETLKSALESAQDSSTAIGTKLEALKTQQDGLGEKIKAQLRDVSQDTVQEVLTATQQQARAVSEIGDAGSDAVIKAFDRSISGLKSTSDDVVKDAKGTVDQQRADLTKQGEAATTDLEASTEASLKTIAAATAGSTQDVEGARALLASSLNRVMLDLGDRKVNGSGLLGSMSTNAAKAGTADYQMALASQNAEGYANIRSQDVSSLLLRQAQFKAALTAADELPAFHLDVPSGATSQTLYTLHIGADQ